MPPIEILASTIFAQSFIVFVVAGLMWTMYLRVRETFLALWACSWLAYGFYLATGGFGFLANIGGWASARTQDQLMLAAIWFSHMGVYLLWQGTQTLLLLERFRIKHFIGFNILMLPLISGAIWLGTSVFPDAYYLLTIGLRSMVAGVVTVVIAVKFWRGYSEFRGARVIAICLIVYGVMIQTYFVQGILGVRGSSLAPVLIGSLGLIDFLIQTVVAFSVVSWILQREHETVLVTQNRLQELAWEDNLTGLPNRLWLDERSGPMLEQMKVAGSGGALIFIDLDGFKGVNDTWGHAVGDHLLVLVAAMLRNSLGEDDMVCRMGGDEFIWFMVGNEDRQNVLDRARAFQAQLESIDEIDDHKIHISCSQGVAWFPDHGVDLETLIQLSDQAMYQAKEQGKAQLVEAVSE